MEKLTLQNLCGGAMESKFQTLYPELISRCKSGEKSSMTIVIEFERVPDTATMVRTSYTMKSKTPGSGSASLCQMNADFELETDAPAEMPQPVSLFRVEGGKA